ISSAPHHSTASKLAQVWLQLSREKARHTIDDRVPFVAAPQITFEHVCTVLGHYSQFERCRPSAAVRAVEEWHHPSLHEVSPSDDRLSGVWRAGTEDY